MTLTTHAAIGALIGTTTLNPALGFLAGFASHLIVDILPHGDTGMYDGFHGKTKRKRAIAYVGTDAACAILLLMAVVAFRGDTLAVENTRFASAVVGSVLPDALVGLGILFHHKLIKQFERIHFFFHDAISRKWGDVPLVVGLGYQLIAIALMWPHLISG